MTEAKDAVLDEDGKEIEAAVEEVTEPVMYEAPTMEAYEITPAVKAVKKKSETVVVRPETVVEKTPWKDTVE